MKRLTSTYWQNLDPWECCGQDHYCQRGCHDKGGCTNGCIVPRLYSHLAAYEDTGLTPGEILGLCSMKNRAKMAELLREEEKRPLPLDELREMVGEPIYIVDFEFPEHSGWEICEEIHTDVWCNCDNVAAYGKTWLAYRRKPEEAAT